MKQQSKAGHSLTKSTHQIQMETPLMQQPAQTDFDFTEHTNVRTSLQVSFSKKQQQINP